MWNNTDIPLAFLISFRTYATWLHGDERGSIDRRHNLYGSPYIEPNAQWCKYNEQLLRAKPLILNARQRKVVDEAVRETCAIRKWALRAINVRTNHVHVVVTANKDPDLVLNAFKETQHEGFVKNGYGEVRRVLGRSKEVNVACGMKRVSQEPLIMYSTVREMSCHILIERDRPTRYRVVVLTVSKSDAIHPQSKLIVKGNYLSLPTRKPSSFAK